MSGFLGDSIKLPTWVRATVTRCLAIIPALIIAFTSGQIGLGRLLVLTQVVLSLQLPFAVWPLVQFTSTNKIMTIKCFKKGAGDSVSGMLRYYKLCRRRDRRNFIRQFMAHDCDVNYCCVTGICVQFNAFDTNLKFSEIMNN
jgi:Mn2+/Fe2+ NRAMP family transporter